MADIDTLGQSLNQSMTQMITSVTTIIGVLVINALDQSSDDSSGAFNTSAFHRFHFRDHETFPEVLPRTVEIPR